MLGHLVDKQGIQIHPDQVNKLANQKTPMNMTLIASFIGTARHLAPGCKDIRIPMQVLSKILAPTHVWRWSPTEARAFQQVKDSINK